MKIRSNDSCALRGISRFLLRDRDPERLMDFKKLNR